MNLDDLLSLTPDKPKGPARTNYVMQNPEPALKPTAPAAMPLPKPKAVAQVAKPAASAAPIADPVTANKLDAETASASLGKPAAVNTDPSPSASPTTGNEFKLSGKWKDAAKYALIGGIPTLFGALFGEAGIGATVGGKIIGEERQRQADRELAGMKSKQAKSGVVNMVSPTGELKSLPQSQAEEYASKGWTLTTSNHLIAEQQLTHGQDRLKQQDEQFTKGEARRQQQLTINEKNLSFKISKEDHDRVVKYGKAISDIGYHVGKERVAKAVNSYDTLWQDPKYKGKDTIVFHSNPAMQDPNLKQFLQDTVTLGYEYLTGESGAQFSAREMNDVFGMLGIPRVAHWAPSDWLSAQDFLDQIRYIDRQKIGAGLGFMDRVLDSKATAIRAGYRPETVQNYERSYAQPHITPKPIVKENPYETRAPMGGEKPRSGSKSKGSLSNIMDAL